jgi:hypothetical protein
MRMLSRDADAVAGCGCCRGMRMLSRDADAVAGCGCCRGMRMLSHEALDALLAPSLTLLNYRGSKACLWVSQQSVFVGLTRSPTRCLSLSSSHPPSPSSLPSLSPPPPPLFLSSSPSPSLSHPPIRYDINFPFHIISNPLSPTPSPYLYLSPSSPPPLRSVGCILAELLARKPLFPGEATRQDQSRAGVTLGMR